MTSGAPLEKAESAGGEQGTLTLIFQDGTRTVIGEKELLGELPEEEAAQLAAFAASPERWLAKLPDAGLYYYYAVTDLDADGQLEIPLVCLDAEGGAQLCAVTEYAGDGEFVSVSPEPAGKALLDGAGPRILDITEYSNGPAYFGAAGKTSGPAADEADPESRRGGRSFYLMWGNRYTRDDRKHFLTGSALAAEEEKLLQIPLVERFVETDDRGHRSCSDSWAETGEDGLPGEMKPAEEDRLFGAAQERIRTFAGEDLQRGYYQIKWHADFVWEQGGPLEIETEEESAVKALLESLYRGWRAGSLEAILSDR